METIALLGVGMMGEAILAGLLRSGHPAGDLIAVEKRSERAAELASAYGVQVLEPASAVAAADVLVLAVKPGDVTSTLADVAQDLKPGKILISLAAGVTTARLEEQVPDEVAVLRVMPNTPALIGQGMAAISPGSQCPPSAVELARRVMAAVGDVVIVPETQQDAVTAVSGSGPAYLFLVAEAMIEAGVREGLARPDAARLVRQTLAGSAALLAQGEASATSLRESVTSPGGTTAAALAELERGGVRTAFLDAVAAARRRSSELSG